MSISNSNQQQASMYPIRTQLYDHSVNSVSTNSSGQYGTGLNVNNVLANNNNIDVNKNKYRLIVRQQPKHSRMCGYGEKVDRRPVDPPPVVQVVLDSIDARSNTGVHKDEFLSSPYFFMYCSLCTSDRTYEVDLLKDGKTRATTGSIVSSLYRLRDLDQKEGGFFVFPDLSVRIEGEYTLKFCLFEIVGDKVFFRSQVFSDVFKVYAAKQFPGMEESTELSKIFAEQGLKIRIRKELRVKRRQQNDSAQSSNDGRGHSQAHSKTDLQLPSVPQPHYQSSYKAPPPHQVNTMYHSQQSPYQQVPTAEYQRSYHNNGPKSATMPAVKNSFTQSPRFHDTFPMRSQTYPPPYGRQSNNHVSKSPLYGNHMVSPQYPNNRHNPQMSPGEQMRLYSSVRTAIASNNNGRYRPYAPPQINNQQHQTQVAQSHLMKLNIDSAIASRMATDSTQASAAIQQSPSIGGLDSLIEASEVHKKLQKSNEELKEDAVPGADTSRRGIQFLLH